MSSTKHICLQKLAGACSLAIFFLFTSCNETIQQPTGEKKTDFPSQIIYDANMVQHDSGRVVMRFKAPLVEKYEYVKTPYTETTKGLYIEFYNKEKPKTPGKLWADYAKMVESKGLYMAKGDVKIINPEGQTFKMQSIYWDKKKREIYTHDTVYITDKDGNILIGSNGMHAKDDLSSYSLYSTFGEANPNKLPDLSK